MCVFFIQNTEPIGYTFIKIRIFHKNVNLINKMNELEFLKNIPINVPSY